VGAFCDDSQRSAHANRPLKKEGGKYYFPPSIFTKYSLINFAIHGAA